MLPARVQVSAVEINIEVPVIRPHGSTARWLFPSKVNKVLELNVVPKGLDIFVEEETEQVSNCALEDKGQDP